MEKSYDIGYAIVSLIFVTNAAGFIAAAFFIDALHQRLGRAKTLMLSELMIIAGYILIGVRPPFAVVVASYFLLGAGAAINLALNNVFCANLANSTVILGASHGSYGLGGTIAPIAATALVSKDIVWSRFYLIIVAVRVLILPFAGWAFGNYEKEAPSTLLERSAYGATTRESKVAMLKRALRNRVTILGALFIFAYQGAEVSISGWVISFLISYRGGDPGKVGYVTAGFWAGITIGRFVLTHLTSHIGDKVSVYGLVAGTTALQILVWLVPNVISNAVFVSLLRLLLGPVYPCAQSIFSHSLPRSIQMSSIGLISSAGSSGGAVAPFMTGLLAQAKGTWVLHPICVSLFGCMVVCWWCLPRVEKRAV
ncbi:MFS efflux transporter [Pseudovirgaria hyperparasitica]|uniref:MFS efflux transporter n=1 Tax=Pseudovirgaria hyperparasitica TaxID=470096 RepID=A0A6A6VYS8_9PEZI|nr:MFS efflux transporter [Pseudovirgaria hyperparasitica]KAF2755433.1 MFS efflux transporter [Pseudovirgaria hyperparasitica]